MMKEVSCARKLEYRDFGGVVLKLAFSDSAS